MNLFSCGIVIFCCTFIGYRLSYSSKEQQNLFADLSSFCVTYETNLAYRQLPVSKLLSERKYGKRFEILKDNYLNGGGTVDNKDVNISDFFAILGKSDATSQQKELQFYKNYFEQMLQETTTQYKQKGQLYKRLGVLCGLLICILLF